MEGRKLVPLIPRRDVRESGGRSYRSAEIIAITITLRCSCDESAGGSRPMKTERIGWCSSLLWQLQHAV